METNKNVVALNEILSSLFDENIWDDGSLNTARRVVAYWQEFHRLECEFNFTTFPAVANQLIVVKDIEFSSLCSHHLLPFYGVAHVGYIPNRLMVGLSKIPRMVDFLAHRPCTQEALTARIATELKTRLEAMGVAVVINSRHTCMACRGAKAFNASMTTSEMRGVFLTSGEARSEFLSLIGAK
jgi:GTP cyclohydrolase I